MLELTLLEQGSSDGFAVGLTALCLHFSQWLQKGEDLGKHVGLLKASYYEENPHRSNRHILHSFVSLALLFSFHGIAL